MTGTDTKPAAAVEAYFADPGRVGASGGENGRRSSHGPLANLLNAVGASLEPRVSRVGELAGRGAGDARLGPHAASNCGRTGRATAGLHACDREVVIE